MAHDPGPDTEGEAFEPSRGFARFSLLHFRAKLKQDARYLDLDGTHFSARPAETRREGQAWLVANAEAMGTRLLEGLRKTVGHRRIVGDVRGRGLMVCVDLVAPDGSGRSLDGTRVAALDRKAWDRGVIVYARGSVLRLAPPLCITAQEVDQLVTVVADSVEELERDLTA